MKLLIKRKPLKCLKSNIRILVVLAAIFSIYTFSVNRLKHKDHLRQIKIYRHINNPPKKIQIGNENVTTEVTIVTLMFNSSKSKHTVEEYEAWLETMFQSFGQPFVAYVDEYWFQIFIRKSHERNLTGYVYIVESIWEIMGEFEKSRNRTYLESYIFQQNDMDPENLIHSPELYAIWNLKMYLLNKTAHLNPFRSEFFLFTDSGAWRERVFSNWPDVEFAIELGRNLQDRILMGLINQPIGKKLSIREDFIQSGFFFGSPEAIRSFSDEYYLIHDEWLDNGRFVGKEQNLLNYLAFVKMKDFVVKLKTESHYCLENYDKWFFYQYYFAQFNDFFCFVDRFSILFL